MMDEETLEGQCRNWFSRMRIRSAIRGGRKTAGKTTVSDAVGKARDGSVCQKDAERTGRGRGTRDNGVTLTITPPINVANILMHPRKYKGHTEKYGGEDCQWH